MEGGHTAACISFQRNTRAVSASFLRGVHSSKLQPNGNHRQAQSQIVCAPAFRPRHSQRGSPAHASITVRFTAARASRAEKANRRSKMMRALLTPPLPGEQGPHLRRQPGESAIDSPATRNRITEARSETGRVGTPRRRLRLSPPSHSSRYFAFASSNNSPIFLTCFEYLRRGRNDIARTRPPLLPSYFLYARYVKVSTIRSRYLRFFQTKKKKVTACARKWQNFAPLFTVI